MSRPLDHGYSWVVLGASCVMTYLYSGSLATISSLLVDLTITFPDDKGLMAWMTALYWALGQLMSVPISCFIGRYGRRWTGLISVFIMSLSSIIGAVTANKYALIVCIGCIAGFLGGVMNCVAFISIKKYFRKRWVFSQAIAATCFPLGASTYPLLIRVLTFYYSWHGALMIHAALQLHAIPCCLLLKQIKANKSTYSNCKRRTISQEMPIDDKYGGIPAKLDTTNAKKSEILKPFQRHPLLALCVLAITMIHAGNATIFTLSPLMGNHVGSTKMEGTLLISIAAIINMPGRLIFGILGNLDRVNPRIVCGCAGLIGGIVAIAVSFVDSYMNLALLIAAFSVPQSAFMTLNTVTAVDEVADKHDMPIAIGCTFMAIGLGNLITVGSTGILLQITGNPRLAYQIFGVVEIMGGFLYIGIHAIHSSGKCRKLCKVEYKKASIDTSINNLSPIKNIEPK